MAQVTKFDDTIIASCNNTEQKSLLGMIRIERELSELLGIKIDLLTEQAVSPYLIDRIRQELKVIS